MSVILNQNEFVANIVNLLVKTKVNKTTNGKRINELIDSSLVDAVKAGDSYALRTIDTLDVKTYSDTSSILSVEKPVVDEQILSTTDKKYIQLTLNRYIMQGAFADEYSLSECLAEMETMLEKTKAIYMYKKIVKAYQDWVPTQATQTITVDLVDTSTLTGVQKIEQEKDNALTIYKALKKVAINIQAPSRKYNDIEFEEMYNADELIFVENSKFESIVNTYAIASLLHSEKLDNIQLYKKSIIIPDEQFTDDYTKGLVIGWLVSEYKYQIAPRIEVATAFEDASTLNLNEFLHFWLISGMANGLAGVKLVANFVAPAQAE